ncbi:MAG: class I SAM-dependent methyltransferase [Planctomycetes bacterium]|nr:class I SAM-dependent methyltransferase [Planctomycetota bacterium]
MSALSTSYVRFAQRSDRPRFLGELYAPLLTGRVLDVGCDEALLRARCAPQSYVGLDRTPQADVQHDLAREARLPFEARSFDTVVCWDVLEHLERPDALFAELVRVARTHLLLSLPNTWNAARKQLRRGCGAIEHYGLPLDPPADRHRWFFSLSEARAYLEGQAARHALEVVELRVLEKPRPLLVRAARRLLHPDLDRYRNLYAHTLAAHFRKA